jgi:hypothetical protein
MYTKSMLDSKYCSPFFRNLLPSATFPSPVRVESRSSFVSLDIGVWCTLVCSASCALTTWDWSVPALVLRVCPLSLPARVARSLAWPAVHSALRDLRRRVESGAGDEARTRSERGDTKKRHSEGDEGTHRDGRVASVRVSESLHRCSTLTLRELHLLLARRLSDMQAPSSRHAAASSTATCSSRHTRSAVAITSR